MSRIRLPRAGGVASLLTVAALTAALVAGCSSGSTDAAPAATELDGAFPVTIDGAFGSATIESAPERVLALSATDSDYLLALALGIDPIAIPSMPTTDAATGGTSVYPWQQGLYPEGTPKVSAPSTDVDVEAIAAFDPDLIVATGFWGLDQQVFDQLSVLAPVVHYTAEANADSWQESTRRVGQALGKDADAEAVIDAADTAVAQARQTNPQLDGATFATVISPTADSFWVLCSDQDNMARVMGELGLELTDFAQSVECDGGKGEVSWENLAKIDADFLWVIPDNAEQGAALAQRADWSQLPAVQRSAVVVVPKDTGVPAALGFPSPLSLEWAVGELAPQFAEAVDR